MGRRTFVTLGAIGVMNSFLQSVSEAQPTLKPRISSLCMGACRRLMLVGSNSTPKGGRAERHVGCRTP